MWATYRAHTERQYIHHDRAKKLRAHTTSSQPNRQRPTIQRSSEWNEQGAAPRLAHTKNKENKIYCFPTAPRRVHCCSICIEHVYSMVIISNTFKLFCGFARFLSLRNFVPDISQHRVHTGLSARAYCTKWMCVCAYAYSCVDTFLMRNWHTAEKRFGETLFS